jgi:selenide,water dikinase
MHPDRIWTNAGARAGDALVLTKPLGTGVLFNANRSGKLPYRELETILTVIAALNAKAREAALRFAVHACTDITGFGILGHSVEMARGGGVRIELDYRSLPLHPNAVEMYRKGVTTGSNSANRKAVEGFWDVKLKLASAEEELLFDPQTSGGLLLSLPESQADALVRALKASGIEAAARVGRVVESDHPRVSVR